MNSDDLLMRGALVEYIKNYQCAKCSDIGLCGHCAVFIALKLIEDAPAVPHEMSAREYLAAEQRMCFDENIGKRNCTECYLSSMRNPHGINCHDYAREYPNEAVAIVEEWAQEHPEERSKE